MGDRVSLNCVIDEGEDDEERGLASTTGRLTGRSRKMFNSSRSVLDIDRHEHGEADSQRGEQPSRTACTDLRQQMTIAPRFGLDGSQDDDSDDLPSSQRSYGYSRPLQLRGRQLRVIQETQDDDEVTKEPEPAGDGRSDAGSSEGIGEAVVAVPQPASHADAWNAYQKLFLKEGRLRVAREVFELERDFHPRMRMNDEATWCNLAMQILLATDDMLLKAVLGGSLCRQMHQNPSLDAHVRKIESAAKATVRQPCQYMFELVDGVGRPPTNGEMLKIADIAMSYAKNDHEAWTVVRKVDTCRRNKKFTEAAMKAGERRYLAGQTACDKLAALVDELREDLADQPVGERMRQPLREVGYTADWPLRCNHHTTHTNSNYLMNLFEAISIEYLGWSYQMYGHAISLVFAREHAACGEILFSSIAQSYTKTGRGFNHAAAGSHNTSAGRISDEQYAEWWKRMCRDSPFIANKEHEKVLVAMGSSREMSLLREREQLKLRLYPASQQSTQQATQIPNGDLLTEFRRREQAGGFASEEDRAAAEDLVYRHLLREKKLWQKVCDRMAEMKQILCDAEAGVGSPHWLAMDQVEGEGEDTAAGQ